MAVFCDVTALHPHRLPAQYTPLSNLQWSRRIRRWTMRKIRPSTWHPSQTRSPPLPAVRTPLCANLLYSRFNPIHPAISALTANNSNRKWHVIYCPSAHLVHPRGGYRTRSGCSPTCTRRRSRRAEFVAHDVFKLSRLFISRCTRPWCPVWATERCG
jgi:hypothetical protein